MSSDESVWDDARWRAYFSAVAGSATRRRVRREAYGDDYPEEADPTSYRTLSDPRLIARELTVGAGQNIVILGCGRGGPGLWLARETGVNLVGIDSSSVVLELATARAQELGLAARAQFGPGHFQATGLPDASFDGALSVDVLLFVDDKAAAIREVARILHAGARFAFTTWDSDLPQLSGVRTPQVGDHRPLLEESGFSIQLYDQPPDWLQRQRAVYEGHLAARAALIQELGDVAARRLLDEATGRLPELPYIRRILAVARKT